MCRVQIGGRLLGLLITLGSLLATDSAEAGPLLDWLFHRRRQPEYTFYTPVTTPAANAVAGNCGPGYCQQTVVQYVPQVAYRTVWAPVPVTQYRTTTTYNPYTGLPITCTRPCVTYTYQARRVPYTTYRPVLAQVPLTLPTSATGGVAPASYQVGIAGYTPGSVAPGSLTTGSGLSGSVLPSVACPPATTGVTPGVVPGSAIPSTTYPSGTAASPSGLPPGVVANPDGTYSTPWTPANGAAASQVPGSNGQLPADLTQPSLPPGYRPPQDPGVSTNYPYDYGQPPSTNGGSINGTANGASANGGLSNGAAPNGSFPSGQPSAPAGQRPELERPDVDLPSIDPPSNASNEATPSIFRLRPLPNLERQPTDGESADPVPRLLDPRDRTAQRRPAVSNVGGTSKDWEATPIRWAAAVHDASSEPVQPRPLPRVMRPLPTTPAASPAAADLDDAGWRPSAR